MGLIYKATNRISDKSYIGYTTGSLAYRQCGHLAFVERGSNLIFHNALRKYGMVSFDWTILEESEDENVLRERERFYIADHGTVHPSGYNMTLGGEGGGMLGHNHTEETKQKIRDANTGRHLSEEVKRKISEKLKGKSLSAETKAKISARSKGRPLSAKNKASLSESHKALYTEKTVCQICGRTITVKMFERHLKEYHRLNGASNG